MLKREHRLPPTLRLSHAKIIRLPFLTVKYQTSTEAISRASVVVSKRVSPLATKRNELKRQVQTILATHISSFPYPLDLLVLLAPQARTTSKEELQTKLDEALTKLTT